MDLNSRETDIHHKREPGRVLSNDIENWNGHDATSARSYLGYSKPHTVDYRYRQTQRLSNGEPRKARYKQKLDRESRQLVRSRVLV